MKTMEMTACWIHRMVLNSILIHQCSISDLPLRCFVGGRPIHGHAVDQKRRHKINDFKNIHDPHIVWMCEKEVQISSIDNEN